MIPLIASLAAPVVGVFLYLWLHERRGAVRMIDAVVFGSLPLLIVWEVGSHAWTDRTVWPLAALAAGAGIIYLVERLFARAARHADNLALLFGVASIAFHALIEGAALVPSPEGARAFTPFSVSVVLHRVPVGLMLWWLITPRHGARLAMVAVGSLIVATSIGFVVGSELLPHHDPRIELYQAFVMGTLLHVVFHQGRKDHRHCWD